MVHKKGHRLSCYMNIPKYSKLFIQIVRETSVRESDCPGNVFTGNNRRVMARRRPGNVLSGKLIVRETSVTLLKYLGGNAEVWGEGIALSCLNAEPRLCSMIQSQVRRRARP